MPKFIFLLLFVTVFAVSSFAQQDREKKYKFDTTYIKDLSDRLSIRIYGVNKFSAFDIIDNDSNKTVSYSPNSSLNLGLGVSYRWFGLAVAFNFPFVNNDNHEYGETNRFDFQTNIFTRSLAIDMYYQKYQGFYVENPEDYIPDWNPENPFPQRPDIVSTSLGGSCIYAFRYKKYSSRAVFIQTDLQRKSAGSFLLGGYFSFFNVEGDSAFMPHQIMGKCNPALAFNNLGVSGIGIAGGYSHTFVMWKRLYFSLTLIPGIAYQTFNVGYQDNRKEEHGSFVAGRFAARLALVYNTEFFYGGITAIDDNFSGNTGKEEQNSLNYQIGVVRFFYGMRFRVNRKKN
jgi:hypothetical protein